MVTIAHVYNRWSKSEIHCYVNGKEESKAEMTWLVNTSDVSLPLTSSSMDRWGASGFEWTRCRLSRSVSSVATKNAISTPSSAAKCRRSTCFPKRSHLTKSRPSTSWVPPTRLVTLSTFFSFRRVFSRCCCCRCWCIALFRAIVTESVSFREREQSVDGVQHSHGNTLGASKYSRCEHRFSCFQFPYIWC